MSELQVVLLEPAKAILSQIGQFLVNLLLVLIILVIGWVVSKLARTVIARGLRAARLDELSDQIGLDAILAKGGISYSLSELVGVIGYWLLLLVTFVVAVNAVGLTVAAELLQRVVLYVPNIIAALFILILGIFVATLLKNIVQTSASNAGISQSNLLSKTVEVIVVIFTIAITLEQLGIGAKIIELIIALVLASVGLSIALAFGLGCKDIAGKTISDIIDKLKKK